MHLDLVEAIMRHTGYLTSSYVRMTEEEKRSLFHAGEHALYITRADHRIQGSQLENLKQLNEDLKNRLEKMEASQRDFEENVLIKLGSVKLDKSPKVYQDKDGFIRLKKEDPELHKLFGFESGTTNKKKKE